MNRLRVAYLRKSRSDQELEKETGQDTLKRHREILLNLAKQRNVVLDKIYEEVVSGETIIARPEIQKLLRKIEENKIEEVWVVDVDRLARGDTEDQGRISKTFKFGNTKIITPAKIYDPNNEFDEEYFEFGLFMSRREYKIINRRMNRGRISSVNEGKFVSSTPPYGYDREKLKGQKGFRLIINYEESKIVKLIFDMASKGTGSSNIANYLNKIGSRPRKAEVWVSASIRSIIENPTYLGKIKWNWRKTQKTMKNGIIYKSRPKQQQYILVDGLHEPLVDEEIWNLANKTKQDKAGKSVRKDLTIQNPLAGLVECGYCHRNMQRRNYRSGHIDGLICPLPHCQNIGSHLYLVENAILGALEGYLKQYEQIIADYQKNGLEEELNSNTIELIDKELNKTKKQLNNVYDLLEQGLYDNDTFRERSNSLKEKITQLETEKEQYSIPSKNKEIEKIKDVIPKMDNIIKNYDKYSIEEKNIILKGIIQKVYYTKNVKGKGHESDFELKIIIK